VIRTFSWPTKRPTARNRGAAAARDRPVLSDRDSAPDGLISTRADERGPPRSPGRAAVLANMAVDFTTHGAAELQKQTHGSAASAAAA